MIRKKNALPKKNVSQYSGFMSFLDSIGFCEKSINELAIETKFMKRFSGKITPLEFLTLVVFGASNGYTSYNDLAFRQEAHGGASVTRQAIAQRFTAACQAFFEKILMRMTSNKSGVTNEISLAKSGGYKRIIVQDSTVIRLPMHLFKNFSGVSNGTSKVCNARIQAVIDLLSGQFLFFSIDAYSKNDLVASPELELQEGDLILRDRGYLIYDEFERHIEAKADCIFRHKHKLIYRDVKTDEKIDLTQLLETHGELDMEVLLNNPQRTRVRLVAAPVNEETANLRRMKLRNDQKGHNPSAENLKLMSWTIFITTITKETADFKQLHKTYAIRWRIEMIFKSWKSNAHFSQIHNVSETQLRILITARLIMSVLVMGNIFTPARLRIREKHGRELSLMKVTRYMSGAFQKWGEIFRAIVDTSIEQPGLDSLLKYCLYDKRERQNFNEEFADLMTSWAIA
jgi:hypothetical protein